MISSKFERKVSVVVEGEGKVCAVEMATGRKREVIDGEV